MWPLLASTINSSFQALGLQEKTTNQQIASIFLSQISFKLSVTDGVINFFKSSKSVWESVVKIPGAFDHGLLFLNS